MNPIEFTIDISHQLNMKRVNKQSDLIEQEDSTASNTLLPNTEKTRILFAFTLNGIQGYERKTVTTIMSHSI